MKKTLVLAIAAAACSTVFAQSTGHVYGEAAYSAITVKDVSKDNLGTFRPTGARLTLGTVVTDNVAVEGFVLQGLSSSSNAIRVNNVSGSLDVKLKTSYGVAVRPFVHLSKDVELFGRVGAVRVENEGTITANGRSGSESSKSTNTLYGVGVAYKINDAFRLTADYTKLSTKDDAESSLVSVGLRYNF